jgi:hypothetical protein
VSFRFVPQPICVFTSKAPFFETWFFRFAPQAAIDCACLRLLLKMPLLLLLLLLAACASLLLLLLLLLHAVGAAAC